MMADKHADDVVEARNVEEMEIDGRFTETPANAATDAVEEKIEKEEKVEEKIEKKIEEKIEEKKEGPKYLDLAFAMDCTGSMGSYIDNARQNIRKIVEHIVAEEKADVRLALVEYRDHPPQDSSFITRVHDFTESVRSMKQWLDNCSAQGGGDTPEAVADALQQVLKLDWRADSTKVCVFIADAPPHGLGRDCSDGFPNGCPAGIDPMEVTHCLTQKGVSLYMVGCEPSITPYREFFMSLAHLTGGQYVPLGSAHLLAKVITGGVQEEMSLQQLMAEVNQEVMQEFQAGGDTGEITEDHLTTKVHQKLKGKGARARKLQWNNAEIPEATPYAQAMSSCTTYDQVQKMEKARAPQQQQQQQMCGSASRRMRSSGAVASDPPGSSSKPGFFSRLFSFGRSAPPPLPASAGGVPPAPLGGAEDRPTMPQSATGGDDACYESIAPPPTTASEYSTTTSSDTYGCIDDEISEYQVQRMVQKSVWSNNLNTRYKKNF